MPNEYWNDTSLRLANGSSDGKYEKTTRKKATVPHNYVSDLQTDLIQLGYLTTGADTGQYGPQTERAVKRFQRHARRNFRWDGKMKSTVAGWGGTVTGVCDASTAKEVRAWIDKAYGLPLKVVPMTKIDGGQMRQDAAKVWREAIKDATAKGVTLVPPGTDVTKYYGDTWRNPVSGFKPTGGNSKLSLHYTGRAVDVSQALLGIKKKRWWVAREEIDKKTYWRVYGETDKQDGTQGTKIEKETKKYYAFHNGTEAWLPAGYYVDITEFLKAKKFERIPAHADYKTNSKAREWWHFHYTEDLQETFLDEMELIGVTEQQLKTAGWTEADLDKKPG